MVVAEDVVDADLEDDLDDLEDLEEDLDELDDTELIGDEIEDEEDADA